ncbi:hypothetical protein SUGI_0567020 [Cryptomeria japonica]|nr:hypothetical protein SUGI_0567020 [Cryptomeria japonica]
MVSRSYSNLLDLASGDMPNFGRTVRRLPRVMTVPGIISEFDDDNANSVASDAPSSVCMQRMIIVANQLPLRACRKPDGTSWFFSWDEDSLLLQLKDGLSDDIEVVYVGCLKVEVDLSDQDDVAQILLENFKCVPTFLPSDLQSKFYHGFCKQQLWPLFHYMLPLSPDHGGRFDRSLWQAYVSANKIFADKVMEVINPEDDFVWVNDYHLMVLPTFLRKRFNRVKLGFFLHSPFPSSEIYRTLPVRDEILRALLNADLIGFHTFDYARHFLSCCSRMLGIDYQSKRGYIGLDYYGRTVGIKILPVGIHMGQLETVLNLSDTAMRVGQLREEFKGKKILLGVDDMDIFKGISLKLLAMEQLLRQHSEWRGKLVLVQIANPARGRGKDVQEIQNETHLTTKRINETFGFPGYKPVILLDKAVPLQGCPKLDEALGLSSDTPKKSMLVVSEFIGCSPSLSGAIRVNPWNIEAVADAINAALTMPVAEQQLRHEKHYSGRGRQPLSEWFSPCQKLGIAAEHGYFTRWSKDSEWENTLPTADFDWMKIAKPVMKLYTETTDGSSIEEKDSALVWHHQDADPDFGSCQSKELLDHLESVLANEPVEVKSGQHIVEVKPQGISKGLVAERLLSKMVERGKPPDFVMCIGDDRSDEDMFESIASAMAKQSMSSKAEVFACTVGQKPSKAKYYLDDTVEFDSECVEASSGWDLFFHADVHLLMIAPAIKNTCFLEYASSSNYLNVDEGGEEIRTTGNQAQIIPTKLWLAHHLEAGYGQLPFSGVLYI